MVAKRKVRLVWNTCHVGLHRDTQSMPTGAMPQILVRAVQLHFCPLYCVDVAVSAQARANVLDEDMPRAFHAFSDAPRSLISQKAPPDYRFKVMGPRS